MIHTCCPYALTPLRSIIPPLLLLVALTALHSHANSLPPPLLATPDHVHAGITPLTGLVDDVKTLSAKPRAIIGYVSDQGWAFIEFLCMMHASWRYVTGFTEGRFKIDLVAFVHPRWAREVSSICEPLNLEDVGPTGQLATLDSNRSQCFAIMYPPPPETIWFGYPFINNVHFFADPRVQHLLVGNYGYAMKTDFDAFITPMFMHFWPDRFTFGVQEYVVVPETAQRLVAISGKLGLRHRGQHNLGPTWYGDVATLIALANFSIPIMHHVVTREFDQKPEGGIKQDWARGEGWPQWSGGIAALYATEIAANHLLEELQFTRKLDEHGDNSAPWLSTYHIHCRHGDKDFSKFEFFQHHYDAVDLSKLDINYVNDYATFLAASTWRQLMQVQGQRQQQQQQQHGEL